MKTPTSKVRKNGAAARRASQVKTSAPAKLQPRLESLDSFSFKDPTSLILFKDGTSIGAVDFSAEEIETIKLKAAANGKSLDDLLMDHAKQMLATPLPAAGNDKTNSAVGEMELALLQNSALFQLILESMECQIVNGTWTEIFANTMASGIAQLAQSTKDRLAAAFDAIHSATILQRPEVAA